MFKDRAAAVAAFDRALKAAGAATGKIVKLEKRLSFALQDSGLTSDKRKAPDPAWTGVNDYETARMHQIFDPFFR
jgi:hypothetical protein